MADITEQYYILTQDGTVYTLDSTTGMTYTLSGETTDSKVEAGFTASDHYVVKNTIVSLTGVITDIDTFQPSSHSSLSGDSYTKHWLERLSALQKSGSTFSVGCTSSLEVLSSCVFTSLVVGQGGDVGTAVHGDRTLSAFNVQMGIKQIRVAAQSVTKTVLIDVDKSVEKEASDKVTSGAVPEDLGTEGTFQEGALRTVRGIRALMQDTDWLTNVGAIST
jgi:hypothetical protein